jgi:uncharacterized protein
MGAGAGATLSAAESVVAGFDCVWQPAAMRTESAIPGIANFILGSLLLNEFAGSGHHQTWIVPRFIGRNWGGALISVVAVASGHSIILPMFRGLLLLALVMVAVALVFSGVLVVAMALMLLRPRRMRDARAIFMLHRLSPADLDLEFEDVSFEVIDQSNGGKLKIAGWWIANPQARGRCAVILHGYSDAKVGGIAWAPLLRELGFSILAIDLRAHGESGGMNSTAGFWERHDVSQVIDQLKAARPPETNQILLFGVSLGAATAAATGAMRDDLAAVILECPFADFHHAAGYQADRLSTPGKLFQDLAYGLAKVISRADFDAVRPVETIPKIPCPLMVIQSCDDPFLSDEDLAAVREAVESRPAAIGPSICWALPETHHVVGLRKDPEGYRKRIEDFLLQSLHKRVEVWEK